MIKQQTQQGEGKEKKPKKQMGIVALKHKMVLDNLMKKAGKGKRLSLRQAAKDAGYSESYANSAKMTKKKSWNELMEQYLPDSLVAETHNDLLKAKKLEYMLFNHDVTDEIIYEIMAEIGCTATKIIHGVQGIHCYFFAPDNTNRKGAAELAYKVKGKMAPEKFEIEQTGIRAMSDEELAETIKKQKARFMKKD